jgi:hypothetical protein
MSIVHPDDRERILESVKQAHDDDRRSCSSTGSSAPTARSAGCSTAAS